MREAVTNWKEWSDVFASAVVISGDKLGSLKLGWSHTWHIKPEVSTEPMHLSRFCTVKRLDRIFYLDVTPTKACLEAMEPHITFVENDVMGFEVIEWPSGKSLVLCRNNRIIAEVWVAKINSITIPDFKED